MTGTVKTKYRDLVRQIALDQYGYVTTADAIEAGVPAIELPKLAPRGGLDNVAYGLYRVSDIPVGEFATSSQKPCSPAGDASKT